MTRPASRLVRRHPQERCDRSVERWAPYNSDCSRYQPPQTTPTRALGSTVLAKVAPVGGEQ